MTALKECGARSFLICELKKKSGQNIRPTDFNGYSMYHCVRLVLGGGQYFTITNIIWLSQKRIVPIWPYSMKNNMPKVCHSNLCPALFYLRCSILFAAHTSGTYWRWHRLRKCPLRLRIINFTSLHMRMCVERIAAMPPCHHTLPCGHSAYIAHKRGTPNGYIWRMVILHAQGLRLFWMSSFFCNLFLQLSRHFIGFFADKYICLWALSLILDTILWRFCVHCPYGWFHGPPFTRY